MATTPTRADAKSWPFAPALLLMLAIGSGFRAWHLFAEPLWLDEAYSAFAADHPIGYIWTVVTRYEVHPPFYYSLLHGWCGLFGHDLAAQRSLGLLAGVAAVLATGWTAAAATRLTGLSQPERRAAIAAAVALAALHPLLIDMSRQVRAYPLMVAAYPLALVALAGLAMDRAAGRPPRRRVLVGFFLAESLMLWLHDLGALYALALSLGLLLVVVRRGLGARAWTWLIGGQAAVGLLYLPALLILRRQAGSWIGSTWLRFDPATVPVDLAGIWLSWAPVPCLLGLGLATAGIVRLTRTSAGARLAAALLLAAILPAALAILASALVSPVFLARTLSPIAVPAIVLMACGVPCGRPWAIASGGALGITLVWLAHTDFELRRAPVTPDWQGVARWLARHRQPGDTIWAYPNAAALPLGYAARDLHLNLPVVPVPGPMPTFDPAAHNADGNPGVPAIGPAEARLIAARSMPGRGTLWLVELDRDLYDPADQFAHALAARRPIAERLATGPVLIRSLSPDRAAPAAAAAAR